MSEIQGHDWRMKNAPQQKKKKSNSQVVSMSAEAQSAGHCASKIQRDLYEGFFI